MERKPGMTVCSRSHVSETFGTLWGMNRTPYPSDVSDGEWSFVAPYLTLISGRARITEGGAPALLHQLAQVYRGPGTQFPPADAPAGYITHIEVERVYGIGPWKTQP